VKPTNSFLIGIAALGLLSAAACSRKVAAVSKPADITPVAAVTPAPAPAQAKTLVAGTNQAVVARPGRPATMPADVRKRLSDELARLEDALFDYDQSSIRSDAGDALRDDVKVIRDILADYPSQKLIIEGHADERGSAEYNLALGDRRAHAVQEFLSTMGIPGPQLAVVSYGKERPVCTDESESCWQKNRRAHLTAAP
jgi:peptidoglycan-associated lipoprotein